MVHLNTSHRACSKRIISAPKACSSYFTPAHQAINSPELSKALRYVSHKLEAKHTHTTFIVNTVNAGSSRKVQGQGPSVTMIPASIVTAETHQVLVESISKAERRYRVSGNAFLQALCRPSAVAEASNYLVGQSLVQHEVLFMSEGLTLLDIDYIYLLKTRLQQYTRLFRPSARAACVEALHLVCKASDTRPLYMSDLIRAYDHLAVSETAIREIHDLYVARFQHAAISFPEDEELLESESESESEDTYSYPALKAASTYPVAPKHTRNLSFIASPTPLRLHIGSSACSSASSSATTSPVDINDDNNKTERLQNGPEFDEIRASARWEWSLFLSGES
ncbi:MAG: hypothetical protein M1838_004226 [Thelocarpon superellum]|nr:MAG: hypothetical protein M1838_004226 [Thelocarpon superellum]